MSSSRSETIIDLKPFLARFRKIPVTPAHPDVTVDFGELVDDPPARPSLAGGRARGITTTWQLFGSLLALAVAIAAIITPLLLVLDPFLSRQHLLLAGLLIYSASILTATGAYWVVCGLVAGWLRRIEQEHATLPHRHAEGEPSPVHRLQATEIDRLL
ncbi:MAG TPA: hypothetical protein VF720_14575, partial [Candidatus Eisenbacteria bacterium]